MKKFILGLMVAGLIATCAAQAPAEMVAPSFAANYSLFDLPSIPGVPNYYGGMVFKAGDPSHLLIAGHADQSNGAIYEIGLIRDAQHHVIGFSGSATVYATAPYIDCGLAYGPGGVLFATSFPNNTLMEFKPGSTSPDKIISLPIASKSTGTVGFVPTGYPGAGSIQIGSYTTGGFFTGTLTPDGSGTYNIGPLTAESVPGRHPEGVGYVPLGAVGFSGPSMLMTEYGTGSRGAIGAYLLNADGSPNVASRQDFVTGLHGANGGAFDPLTNDYFFASFGNTYPSNRIVEVRGFVRPVGTGGGNQSTVPEPSSLALMSFGGLGLALSAYRRRRAAIV